MISKLQVKYIQSLGQKKHRDIEGLFIAEGPKIVKELLQEKNANLQHLYALDAWIEDNKELLSETEVILINESELDQISQLTTPNQVLAIFRKFEFDESLHYAGISLVLDSIRDPGNMGTIIRIADWFGISRIVCSNDCADVYNPKVVQATMGSIARVPVFYAELSEWLKNQKRTTIYAAVMDGEDVANITDI
ncbi:MAG TPA: RNA methyltransferase, partial [Chitinophagaceae bacterium]